MDAALGRYTCGALLFRQVCQLVWPRRCPLCRRVLGFLPECPDCAAGMEALVRHPDERGVKSPPPGFRAGMVEWAAAPFWYRGGIRSGLLRAKYRDEPWTAVQLGCMLADRLFGVQIRLRGGVEVPAHPGAPLTDRDLLVPVPSSGRGRGYNVPELLCRPLAAGLGVPLDGRALVRARQGAAQAGLPLEERLVNTAGLFRAEADRVAGRRVLLVDDVLTTGATAAACVQALLAAGAESVAVAALASSESHRTLPARPGIPFDWEGGAETLEDF